MANRFEVLCINTSDRTHPHERITHPGGRNRDGRTWKLDQKAAITGIDHGQWVFFVRSGGRTANVIVSVSTHGNKYLKTENDGEQPNKLLSLPEYRSRHRSW